jgi:hypothetical protein
MNEIESAMGMPEPDAAGLGNLAGVAQKVMQKDMIERESPDVQEDKKALITRWLTDIKAAKKHFENEFKNMREDMKFAKGEQWGSAAAGADKYTVNLVHRHITQRVSSLYAKNPKVVAKRRQRMEFAIWDGDIKSIQEAMMVISQATQANMMPPPELVALMEEVTNVKKMNRQYDKIGKTAEIMFAYFMDASSPTFKVQAKQLIRRVCTCGIGYVKMGFNRSMEKSPELKKTISDLNSRLAVVKQMLADVADGKTEETQAEYAELEMSLKVMQEQKDVIINEGLVFDFPKSTSIIPSPSTTSIKGWINTDWIAQEFYFTCDEIKQIYDIDVTGSGTTYGADTASQQDSKQIISPNEQSNGGKKKDKYAVYEVQHKDTGMIFTICDGYMNYLKEPSAPKLILPRFYNIYSLSFNDIEDEDNVFPPSDARMLRPMQLEYNRSREGLREHRIANRPAYVTSKGILEDGDKSKLTTHESSEVIELNISRETPIGNVIQAVPKIPIDPAVYDTSPLFDDIVKVVGSQEANFGGTSSSSATEVSVAEGSRMATVSSNVDDLDDLLSELAEDGCRIMLQHVSVETARKIVGNGAVWAELNNQEIADLLYLEVKAGSSGRPNKAQEIANFERLAPTLLQMGGISHTFLAKQALMRLDDSLDLDEAMLEGMPSMIAMNSMTQPSTGDPATDPSQQGAQGGNKAGTPNINAGGQASMPTSQQIQMGNAGG